MDFSVLPIVNTALAAVVVFLLPGSAVLAWKPDPDRDVLERLAEAVGLSVALSALTALLFFGLNRPIGRGGVLFLYGLIAAFGLAGMAVHRRGNSRVDIPWLYLLGFAALVVWRFVQIRGLTFPPWVDAPQHVLIVRRIMEIGGLPQDLGPVLPFAFQYHFGYHVVTALFAGISGAPLEKAALWTGQIFNALISVSVYYLGTRLGHDRKRAGLAGLLVGAVSQMPAYYATWGRFSLLSGLVLLPLAMGAALKAVREGNGSSSWIRPALLASGTFLCHYFTAALLALFYLLLLAEGAWRLRSRQTSFGKGIIGPLAGFSAGLLLILPWILWIWEAVRLYISVAFIAPAQSLDKVYFSDYGTYIIHLLGPLRNYLLILLALPGLVRAFRDPRSRILAFWGSIMGLGTIPWGYRVVPFRPDHLAIVLFIPVCLLVSQIAWDTFLYWQRKGSRTAAGPTATVLLLALLVWGLKETRWIIKPETVLAGEDDLMTIQWIRNHLPEHARFLINADPWEWGLYRGVDGGIWITPLTGRWTSIPPILYGFRDRELIEAVRRRAVVTMALTGCDSAFWELVRANRISHVYLTAGKGNLAPGGLLPCPELKLLHRQGEVYLFKIN